MHQPARSQQLVAKGVTARTGEGELRTLRMKHRALRSGITPLTDRRQGSDRIAPKEGAAIFSQKTYLTENVQLSTLGFGDFFVPGAPPSPHMSTSDGPSRSTGNVWV